MRPLLVILGCLFTTIPASAAEKEPIRITDGEGCRTALRQRWGSRDLRRKGRRRFRVHCGGSASTRVGEPARVS